MPTRKQRRKSQKERRHEYETVWVDEEGNELEEPPEEAVAPPREKRSGSAKASASAKTSPRGQQRGARAPRIPQPPSWRRSIRRSLIWVGVLAALLLWLQSKSTHPAYGAAIAMAAIYALLFPVFTYYLDRTMYRRYEKQQAGKAAPRKR